MPFLMLGEALVDLICEQAAEGLADARAFTPHFGGAAANVAVSAVRAGGRRSAAAPARTPGGSGCSTGCAARASTRASSRSTSAARRRSRSRP
jgi:hypothetical protein